MSSRAPGSFKLLSIAAASALILTACGDSAADEPTEQASEEELTTVTVGTVDGPHAKILEFVDENLAQEEGLDLEIVETDDYEAANSQLAEGEVDANYVQDVPTLDQEIIDHDYEFSYGAGVHIQPYVLFSDQYESSEEIDYDATLGITSEEQDQYRALRLLEAHRLLHELSEGSTLADLTERQNPRRLQFVEYSPEALTQNVEVEDLDGVIVNGEDFDEGELDIDDAALVEEVTQSPYSQVMVWNVEDEHDEKILKLNELLHSDEVGHYILDTWPDGEIIPPNRERLKKQLEEEETERQEEQAEREEQEAEREEDNS